jgi:hypothetical protein
LIEEEKLPSPDPSSRTRRRLRLGFLFGLEKKKKGNMLTEEDKLAPELDPVLEPVEGFEEPKLDGPLSAPSESQPRIDGVWEL